MQVPEVLIQLVKISLIRNSITYLCQEFQQCLAITSASVYLMSP